MRRHVIYSLDDEEPALDAARVDELKAIYRQHLRPEEEEAAVRRGPRGEHHRGYRALSRIANGFMAEDVAALEAYAVVLADRRSALIAEVRAERDALCADARSRGVYDGLLSALEAGQERGRRIAAGFVDAFRAALPDALPSGRHP